MRELIFVQSHQEIDQRTLALHQLIADKIRAEPGLFDNARQTLARWRTIVHASSQPYLEEWERIFEQGIDEALKVATEDSEHATALRQSSPFCGILTERERIKFLMDWKEHHEA